MARAEGVRGGGEVGNARRACGDVGRRAPTLSANFYLGRPSARRRRRRSRLASRTLGNKSH
eukprot:31385-Pelagococcus_subviridis.AAC.13